MTLQRNLINETFLVCRSKPRISRPTVHEIVLRGLAWMTDGDCGVQS